MTTEARFSEDGQGANYSREAEEFARKLDTNLHFLPELGRQLVCYLFPLLEIMGIQSERFRDLINGRGHASPEERALLLWASRFVECLYLAHYEPDGDMKAIYEKTAEEVLVEKLTGFEAMLVRDTFYRFMDEMTDEDA